MRHGVILLPGIITPAELAYGTLRAALPDIDQLVLRDLAIYDGDAAPQDFSLDAEIASVLEVAADQGFDRFHLCGYSAGGAVAAALASRYPERLVSLVLLEPAWLGNNDMDDEERRLFAETEQVAKLPPEQALSEFVRLNLAPGVEPPPRPAEPPPPWMAKRPAGIRAVGAAFLSSELDTAALARFPRPVLYVLGALSNQSLYGKRAERSRHLFSDFKLELFEDRHHFDPPHRAEPERLAGILREFWDRAEAK